MAAALALVASLRTSWPLRKHPWFWITWGLLVIFHVTAIVMLLVGRRRVEWIVVYAVRSSGRSPRYDCRIRRISARSGSASPLIR